MDPLLLGFFKDGMGIAQSASARDALPGLEAQYESKCESEQARCVRARDAAGLGAARGRRRPVAPGVRARSALVSPRACCACVATAARLG